MRMIDATARPLLQFQNSRNGAWSLLNTCREQPPSSPWSPHCVGMRGKLHAACCTTGQMRATENIYAKLWHYVKPSRSDEKLGIFNLVARILLHL